MTSGLIPGVTPGVLLAVLLVVAGPTAAALPGSLTPTSGKVDLEYWAGYDVADGVLALSRVSIEPALKFRFDRAWSAELSLRGEFADDGTGLGTVTTYHSLSRPPIDGRRGHIGLERAALSWKRRRDRVTLGKQTIAWGVLDGLQVTDRYDPVRRRDAVLSENRPDRIARWGARWRTEWRGTRFDVALTPDPSVSQLARRGDEFQATAPRFTAGADAPSDVEAGVTGRKRWLEDATFGLRLARRWSGSELGVLAFSGPDPEPVLRPVRSGETLSALRDHPRRTLIGATYERSAGAFVLRAEAAYIPDQPLNVTPADPRDGFAIDTRPRTLVGAGVDWSGPAGVFVNAQIAVDVIGGDGVEGFRPERQTIATLRAQRGFANDRLRLQGEWIGSLEDGDGVVRPQLRWQRSDNVFFLFGADVIYGERTGIFGQFDDADRVWAKVRLSR